MVQSQQLPYQPFFDNLPMFSGHHHKNLSEIKENKDYSFIAFIMQLSVAQGSDQFHKFTVKPI